MEDYQIYKEKAKKHIKVADHILTQTFKLIKDPKLLVAVLENISLSMQETMLTLLLFERLYKRIPPFHNNFESMFNILKMKLINKYNINKEYLITMQDIKNMLMNHKKSPIEFSRKDAFVICSDNYRTHTLTADQIKKHLNSAKSFFNKIDSIIKDYNKQI